MTGYTQPDLLPFPDNYNDPADVPADIEALARATQTTVTNVNANLQYVAPIGTIVMWPQNSAPDGWHLCNGTTHGSPALAAVLGGSTVTPNLVDRFIIGAGAPKPVGTTGGADAVTLTAGQSGLRDHAHGASTAGASADHSHSGSTGSVNRNASHSHSASINEGLTTGDSTAYIDTADNDTSVGEVFAVKVYATDTNHEHGFSTGGVSADHGHAVTVGGSGWANATEAHENQPPFYALSYIIRKA